MKYSKLVENTDYKLMYTSYKLAVPSSLRTLSESHGQIRMQQLYQLTIDISKSSDMIHFIRRQLMGFDFNVK